MNAGGAPPESAADRPTLEERMDRLDSIAGALEGSELELDQALQLFEEAVSHLREAHAQLQAAELRVEEVLGRADAPELRPLDPDGE